MSDYINVLKNELEWLENVFLMRVNNLHDDIFSISKNEAENQNSDNLLNDSRGLFPPDLDPKISYYANFVVFNKLTIAERLLLILALSPHLKPDLLENIFHTPMPNGEMFYKNCDLGGIKTDGFRGILPTGLTWLFLVAGKNFPRRIESLNFLISKKSELFRLKVLDIMEEEQDSPIANGQLVVNKDYLKVFISNILKKDK